jgi:hypothetical protein
VTEALFLGFVGNNLTARTDRVEDTTVDAIIDSADAGLIDCVVCVKVWSQSSTLVRIKEADLATAEILGAIRESHASHTVALNEIKAQDQSFKSASIPIFEKTHADTATAFQTLTANLTALKENIKTNFASENDSLLILSS